MTAEEPWRAVHKEALRRGEDTYIDPETGRIVFTAVYHLKRGACCESGCRHCPYQDEKGNIHIEKIKGFLAVIIQHELDHLDGALFTKHVMTQGEQLYRSYKNEKGEDEFEEIEI